jgi:hypothetical protein
VFESALRAHLKRQYGKGVKVVDEHMAGVCQTVLHFDALPLMRSAAQLLSIGPGEGMDRECTYLYLTLRRKLLQLSDTSKFDLTENVSFVCTVDSRCSTLYTEHTD